jgi:hypothetical protein
VEVARRKEAVGMGSTRCAVIDYLKPCQFVDQKHWADSEFVTVPETTLPNGTVVPEFQVARYLSSKGPAGTRAMVAGHTW